MTTRTIYRLLIGVAMSLGLAMVLTFLLYTSGLALELWQRFRDAPASFVLIYCLVLGVIVLLSLWWIRKLIRRWRAAHRDEKVRQPLSEDELHQTIEHAEALGIDTALADEELAALEQRRGSGKVYVAIYGEASTGKSALIRALAKGANALSDPRTGTTQTLDHYDWVAPSGTQVVLTDMPGLNAPGKSLDVLSMEEAQRAHIVLYVVEGDLTRTQYTELQRLLASNKPTLVALNKIDLYSDEEIRQLQSRLTERLGRLADKLELIPVSAGGTREVVRIYPDAREETQLQEVAPQITALVRSMDLHLVHGGELEPKRDAAVVALAQRKLEQSTAHFRRVQSNSIISSYTYKAMVGAMAAVSPGMDLLIQGYFGVALVRELCKLYNVSAFSVEIEKFLKLVVNDLGKTLPLVLAAAGNTLKAFPGIGTLAGGVVHAIGYGLIFESLGRAVAKTLEDRGQLNAGSTLQLMEAELSGNLEARARRLAKLVFSHHREP